MGETSARRPRRRIGGLIVVVVVAVAAVTLVVWVVLRDNKTELLAPPVDTTPQLGPDALANQFTIAVAATSSAQDDFAAAQAAASAACSCPAGEQDPQTFAHDAQALLPTLKQQEQLLEDMIPAAAADVAEDVEVVLDLNRQIQADLAQLQEHSGDTDTRLLAKARLDLLRHLAAQNEAIQVVRKGLGTTPTSQPDGSPPSSDP